MPHVDGWHIRPVYFGSSTVRLSLWEKDERMVDFTLTGAQHAALANAIGLTKLNEAREAS